MVSHKYFKALVFILILECIIAASALDIYALTKSQARKVIRIKYKFPKRIILKIPLDVNKPREGQDLKLLSALEKEKWGSIISNRVEIHPSKRQFFFPHPIITDLNHLDLIK